MEEVVGHPGALQTTGAWSVNGRFVTCVSLNVARKRAAPSVNSSLAFGVLLVRRGFRKQSAEPCLND